MEINDIINGCFEFLAGFAVLNHCRTVHKDKAVAGVSVLSILFFSTWGVWNLYYYPSLNQMWSFYGGLFIVTTNLLWVTLLLKYRDNEIKS